MPRTRNPTQTEETYLGDGLYVSFDGYQFKLRAPHLLVDHEVYLEPRVLESFNNYVKEIKDAQAKAHSGG